MNLLNVILSSSIAVIVSYFSILNLSKMKFNLKKFIIYVLLLIPLLIVSYKFFDGTTRMILNIIFIIIALHLSIFKKDVSNSVYYSLAYEMLVFISEIILSIFVLKMFKFNGIEYYNAPFSLLISSVLNCSLVYLLTKVKFISKNIRKLNEIIKKNNKDWIYIILVMILMVLFMAFNMYKMNSTIEYYIYIATIIFVVVSFVYVIYNKFQR